MREILYALPSAILIGFANSILKYRIKYFSDQDIYIFSSQFYKFLLDPFIFSGGLATIFSILWWLSIVSKVRIGVVYPLIQSGAILLTLLLSSMFLKEEVSNFQYFGIFAIIIGIIFISKQ